jgi:hypothetical protein
VGCEISNFETGSPPVGCESEGQLRNGVAAILQKLLQFFPATTLKLELAMGLNFLDYIT